MTQVFTRESLLELLREVTYKPLTAEELLREFGQEHALEDTKLRVMLAQLEEEGEVVQTRTKRYGTPERMNLVVGRLEVKAKGFGFVVPEKGGNDYYISPTDMRGALDGDRVIVRPFPKSGGDRPEGEVIRVLKRARQSLVGVISTFATYGFVKPDDKHLPHEVFVPMDELGGAVDGQKVVVDITSYPSRHQGMTGKVVEILGFPQDPGVDILAVVRKYGLPEKFPDEVLRAAEDIGHEVSAVEIAQRVDLQGETIVTIDGEDAKDLDDAVHVKKLANGHYLLGVHIADVAYYVEEGSALDREAERRGTSVYLVDRVIPMLPPRLSNGICSLNPQVERLTLTCEMEFDERFERVNYRLMPSVIKTAERMTYRAVRDILTGADATTLARYADLVPYFKLMEELALGLRTKREERGAIDFNLSETKVVVDEQGKPLDLVKRERSIAEQIIEEFMLAANETVAEHAHWLELPFMYRVHETPTFEKMVALNEFLNNFGYHLKSLNKIHPRTLQQVLNGVAGRPEEALVSHVLLRSMKQARYASDSLGHFGLATEYYTHFTSPIRRYPDLQIHRILREWIVEGRLSAFKQTHWTNRMPELALHCSQRERNATDAERETDLLKKIEFMVAHVGEEFDGVISGVTGFGVFVELDNSVEGMIHVSYLNDDYYHYHEKLHALIGARMRRVFRIGDRLRIQVAAANKENLTLDFALVAHLSEANRGDVSGEVDGGEAGGEDGQRQTEPKKAKRQKRSASAPVVGQVRKPEQKAHGKGGKKRTEAEPEMRSAGKGKSKRRRKSKAAR